MINEMSTQIDAREARTTLDADGFKLVRVEPGAKQCFDEGWSGEGYTPDFGPEDGTGIHWGEHSEWRVDVEADVPEGIPILKRFLGDTLRFGRPGALGSHNVVRAVGAKTRKFNNTNGEMLIELRSTGTQSVVPPSEHEQGARVWENGYDPTKIKEFGAGELAKNVALAAAATLIAREMPDGGRHDWCLALAGFLVPRVGDDRTYDVLDAAWEAAEAYIEGHTAKELHNIVYDTAEALEGDENVTGGRTVDEATPGVVKLLSKWLDTTLYVPTEEEIRERRRKTAANAWPECEALATETDVLSEIYAKMVADGLIGERTNAHILTLAATSLLAGEPISAIVKGTSSVGKSEIIKRVVKTLPESMVMELQSMSDKALAYMGKDQLKHKVLVVYELGGVGKPGSDSLEMLKQIMSEGRTRRQIAESTPQGVRGRTIEVDGPTALWTTGLAPSSRTVCL
jgi:hypothetical protein